MLTDSEDYARRESVGSRADTSSKQSHRAPRSPFDEETGQSIRSLHGFIGQDSSSVSDAEYFSPPPRFQRLREQPKSSGDSRRGPLKLRHPDAMIRKLSGPEYALLIMNALDDCNLLSVYAPKIAYRCDRNGRVVHLERRPLMIYVFGMHIETEGDVKQQRFATGVWG